MRTGLGKYGTDAARARKSDEGRDEMDEKDRKIGPFPHGSKKLKTRGIAGKLAIRHEQARRELACGTDLFYFTHRGERNGKGGRRTSLEFISFRVSVIPDWRGRVK